MHFTYGDPDFSKLKQGDVLKKTPELLALIQTVHPHYAGDDYLYFQVLTQTCDLVRRNGVCKSRYITLAAVRSLDLIIQRAIDSFSEKTIFENKICCSERYKKQLESVFNKLLNNNDPHHFFLQAAPDFQLPIACCTQLHLSISIRAYEHYETCLGAKILELRENFRAKLGWLVGNLYSRVGTEDYVPGAIPDPETYADYVVGLMNGYVFWVPESDFQSFKNKSIKAAGFAELGQVIEKDRERSKESKLNMLVAAVAKPLGIEGEQKQMIKNILSQHPLLKQVFS